MGLQHFILPFSLLAIGLVLASVVFIRELSIKHIGNSSRVNVDVTEVDVDIDVNVSPQNEQGF